MKVFILINTILLSILITGCVKKITPNGMAIAVPASQITQSLQSRFPLTQNTPYGKITLVHPQVLLKQGSDRITAGANVLFSNAFVSQQSGDIEVSGKPYFDASTGNIYLQEPNIERMEANGYKIASYMQGSIKQIVIPIINEIFRQVPIYKINTSTIHGSFVKNVYVKDGSLLLTFGL